MIDSDKTPKRGDALKQTVLDIALKLFSQRGYFNTSIPDIRKAAGVSTGAIYHHFNNKEALAKSLYQSLLQQMDEKIVEASESQKGFSAKSAAIIEQLFELTEQNPVSMQFILLAQHREYLPNESPICSSAPFQTMKNVVSEGIDKGEIKNMDHWVAATSVFGGALRMMNLQLDGVLDRPLKEYQQQVIDCAWRSVKQS